MNEKIIGIEKVTKEMTFGEVSRVLEFKGYKQYLLYSPKYPYGLEDSPVGSLKLEQISTIQPTWNGETMAMGLNRLLELEKLGKKVKYDIWSMEEKEREPEKKSSMLFHFPGDEGKPFILVCAGGGYTGVASMVEAFPVAMRLNEMGYNAFVLNYRVGQEGLLPAPSEDLAQAIKFVLSHSEEFKVSKENYAVAGFSAGAHLTATLGTDNYGYKKMGIPKPAALFLGYPLISTDEMFDKEKEGFLVTMAGNNFTPEMLDTFCINKNMSKKYPPTYIWMCKDDDTVPFSNSVVMANKLEELVVPYIHKVVEHGGHGLGLGLGTEAEGWLEEAVDFWERL